MVLEKRRWIAGLTLGLGFAVACGPVETNDHAASEAARLESSRRATQKLDAYYVMFEEAPAASLLPSDRTQRIDWSTPGLKSRVAARASALREKLEQRQEAVEQSGATVVYRFVRLANGFQVMATEAVATRLRGIEGVRLVERVPRFERQLSSAVPVVGAPVLWQAGLPLDGTGVSVGVIDSGIDYLHADFGGSGDPQDHKDNDSTIIEPGSFPTDRVVGGYDFVGDDYNPENEETSTPLPDDDPLDCAKGGHGSHVAGIVGGGGVSKNGQAYLGPYEMSLDPEAFQIFPGVAPRSDLVALRVFGCSGATQFLGAALEYAADPNDDDDLSDRLDIVNASLGSSFGLQSQTNAQLVSNLTKAGSLFVAASGNEGATFYATSSPGNYPEALSVAASVDRMFLSMKLEGPSVALTEAPAAEGFFSQPVSGTVSGAVVQANPIRACESIENASEMAGNVAIIDRGDCSFISKAQRAAAAGAIAVIVVDNEFSDAPFQMGGGQPLDVSIPAVMVRRLDGEAIKAALSDGLTISMTEGQRYAGPSAEVFASYSSRGPSTAGNLLKPEVTAPGSAIISAAVAKGSEGTSKQGTSMATPVVAGAAALVLQADPTLSPQLLKARFVNTAFPLSDEQSVAFPISRQGAGRIDVVRAASDEVALYADATDGRVAVSFGSLVVAEATSFTRTVVVDNRGTQEQSLTPSIQMVHALPGVSWSVEPESLTVAAGEKGTMSVTLRVDPNLLGRPGPDPKTPAYQYDLPRHHLSEATAYLSLDTEQTKGISALPLHGVVRAAGIRRAGAVVGCADAPIIAVNLTGQSAHPAPVVTALELTEVHENNSADATDPAVRQRDVRAYGVGSNAATIDSPQELTLYFGMSVEGEWTTPAKGQFTVAGVLIDVDSDEEADFMIVAEPLNKKNGYADVLASSTYDLKTGERLSSRRYLNVLPASEADTAPFNNSVVVFSVFAHELGLTSDDNAIRFRVYSGAETLAVREITDWKDFQFRQPLIDTARFATRPGKPIYDGSMIRVHRNDDDETALPKVLLLHHNNIAAKRWEVVDLSQAQTQAVTVAAELPRDVEEGRRFVGLFNVQNTSSASAEGVELHIDTKGATVDLVSTQGVECVAGSPTRCTLPELASETTLPVRVQFMATTSDQTDRVDVTATVKTPIGCTSEASDSVRWRSAPIEVEDELLLSGGCAVRAPHPGPAKQGPPLLFGVLVALGWLRRRLTS